MTSTPVKDVSSIMNFVGRTPPARSSAGDSGGGFGNAMSKASEVISARQNTETPKNGSDMKVKPKAPPEKEQVSTEQKVEASKAGTGKTSKTDDKAVQAMEEAGKEAVKAVAEELGVSEEEVLAAMEAMGFLPVSLLDPQNLTALALDLSGEDALGLVTNEVLYEQVNDLTQAVDEITGQLLEQTGMNPEELQTLLAQVDLTAEEVPEEPLTEEVPLTPNELAKEQDSPVKDQKEITIIVEKNGEITEVTARTDEKGNVQATKEVTTTAVEENVVEPSQENEESGAGSRQSDDQPQGHDLSQRNTLLESLLQNRTQSVEEIMETVPAFAAPDTEQIMQQIMDYMRIQLKPEMSQLEMQLHPESLGTVNVRIAAKEGMITAQFTAQNDMVKAAIESQLVELKDSLKAQGLKVETVEVNVESQSFESNLWQGQERNQQSFDGNRKNTRRINLNGLNPEELPEDMSQEEQLAAEIMLENGGTVDYTA